MKVAYILRPNILNSGDSNGIKSQARTWKAGLEKLGHTVDEVDIWKHYSWKEYDIIHFFGTGLWLIGLLNELKKKNANLVLSPIIDSVENPFMYKLSTFIGAAKMRLYSPTYAMKKSLPYFMGVFVRSANEAKYLSYSMNYPGEKIFNIPISFNAKIDKQDSTEKEDFCLHVSSIYQSRKNVIRLIQAAKKYKFKLVLAGSKGTEQDFLPIKREIGDAKNIEVLGFVSNEQLDDLYTKAKVFALPSIIEGVGIVALDAAIHGCAIVITNIGGPKEYFGNLAYQVNPYSVDEIGSSILKAMHEKSFQPDLSNHIAENYSLSKVIEQLEESYYQIISSDF
ncbi:MAG: glycosyltransferase [Bacteroidales bacterium]|nr:glycosyltransferase [Bacteroidales bacterium]